MLKNCTDGTVFIPGSGAMQRSDALYKQQVTNVYSGALYKTWCRIREPFMIPYDITNHSCEGHWEKFDVDKAACQMCGKIHVCHSLKCETVCESDGLICPITGLCLGQRLLTQYETTSDYIGGSDAINVLTHNKSKTVNTPQMLTFKHRNPTEQMMQHPDMDTIMRTICNILISDTTQKSIDNENIKMNIKLRTMCIRKIRQYRVTRDIPNICDIEAYLYSKIHGQRIPPLSIEQSRLERLDCARRATTSIAQLLGFMRTHCGNVPTCVKQGGVVVGMLYMMRTGVTIDDITVLPRITALKRLLPMEQHLMSFFKIRPKVVTEAENVIKYNMRNLSQNSLALLAQTQCIVRTT
jgi:hypothetical protein